MKPAERKEDQGAEEENMDNMPNDEERRHLQAKHDYEYKMDSEIVWRRWVSIKDCAEREQKLLKAMGNLKSLYETGPFGEEIWMLELRKSIREELERNAESQDVLGVRVKICRGDGELSFVVWQLYYNAILGDAATML